MRDRLIELLKETFEYTRGTCIDFDESAEINADHLLAKGVIVTKKIIGYEDYSIDEYGNVYSYKSRRYVSQQKQKDGYYYVGLCKDGKRKSFAVHRLVAMHFIENPNCFPQVNHKDENKGNNDAANLEWCDEKYNTNYGTARQRHAEKVSRPVVCIETGKVFLSQLEAGKTISVSHRHICDCIKDKRRTCGGYHWRYASREEAEKALEKMKGGE